ncbi:hypothetical protein WN944_024397 [Citrus x changshan-huyou]|uniref:Uncharacterized protein n=1 Tax=Citrus x changshan-huyou TaxID=2935761 RepID=A0AAP0LU63_9ROSI
MGGLKLVCVPMFYSVILGIVASYARFPKLGIMIVVWGASKKFSTLAGGVIEIESELILKAKSCKEKKEVDMVVYRGKLNYEIKHEIVILFLLKPVLLLAGPIVLTIRSDSLIVGYDFNSQTESEMKSSLVDFPPHTPSDPKATLLMTRSPAMRLWLAAVVCIALVVIKKCEHFVALLTKLTLVVGGGIGSSYNFSCVGLVLGRFDCTLYCQIEGDDATATFASSLGISSSNLGDDSTA